ncbi:Hypothetical predicted protein [Cloeon dipterum]|uniref:Uncharacterized protein n=1 Tax=Cloeon dipterum TaxID=197152 RepID=A0A8S1CEK2_9INSE|nr:Hypothetical predicted protein [Cloeon dipterum]
MKLITAQVLVCLVLNVFAADEPKTDVKAQVAVAPGDSSVGADKKRETLFARNDYSTPGYYNNNGYYGSGGYGGGSGYPGGGYYDNLQSRNQYGSGGSGGYYDRYNGYGSNAGYGGAGYGSGYGSGYSNAGYNGNYNNNNYGRYDGYNSGGYYNNNYNNGGWGGYGNVDSWRGNNNYYDRYSSNGDNWRYNGGSGAYDRPYNRDYVDYYTGGGGWVNTRPIGSSSYMHGGNYQQQYGGYQG